MTRRTMCALLGGAVAACAGTDPPRPLTFGGDRPVTLQTPQSIDFDRHYPLVVVLHGYGANGFGQEAYLGLAALAARDQAFVLAPDGLVDSHGRQFWNADPACCDFDGTHPDDAGYLAHILDEVLDRWPIDRGAVVVVGHSNGGFMAYRLGCDRADVVTHVVSLAGNAASATCLPTRPVTVLHVHGTADTVIPYTGAQPSFSQWVAHNGCAAATAPGEPLDLDTSLPGAETGTLAATGCPAGGTTTLWTIDGGGHVPTITSSFEPALWHWFTANPRP